MHACAYAYNMYPTFTSRRVYGSRDDEVTKPAAAVESIFLKRKACLPEIHTGMYLVTSFCMKLLVLLVIQK